MVDGRSSEFSERSQQSFSWSKLAIRPKSKILPWNRYACSQETWGTLTYPISRALKPSLKLIIGSVTMSAPSKLYNDGSRNPFTTLLHGAFHYLTVT